MAFLLAAAASLAAAGTANAQSDLERAAARDAASSGVAAYEAGQYEQAVEELSRAERLVHAPPHLLYLARAQAKLGKLVIAREIYLKITRERLSGDAPQAFVDAQVAARQEREALDGRVPSVTVKLEGASAGEATVQMDGATLPSAMVGLRMPVDPGQHVFQARTSSGESAPVSVVIAEGNTAEVTLTLQRSQKSTPALVPPSPATSGVAVADSPRTSGHGLRTASYASLTVGAVGVGVGSYFLFRSLSTSGEADELYDECSAASPGGKCSEPTARDEILARDEDAAQQRSVAVGALIVGGVGAALGVTLLILDTNDDDAAARAQSSNVEVALGLGSLRMRGTF